MMKLPLMKCCVIFVALMLEIREDFNATLFTSEHNLQHVVFFSVALHRVNSLMVTAGEWNNQSLVYFLNSPAPILKYYHVFIPTSVWQKNVIGRPFSAEFWQILFLRNFSFMHQGCICFIAISETTHVGLSKTIFTFPQIFLHVLR